MEKQTVLIPTVVAPEMLESLRAYAELEIINPGNLDHDELLAALPKVQGVIIRSNNKMTRKHLAAATNLKVVGRAGTGVDNVDVDAATEAGVLVMNTPGANAISTAEHTIAMMMALARQIPAAVQALKSGKWQRSRFQGVELHSKTLGLVGVGRVGLEVGRCAVGLGMHVVAYDPFVSADAFGRLPIRRVELDEIWKQADFITLHTPLVAETRHLIAAETIQQMKPGVRIINCARGGIVDEEALCDAVESGQVAGAALDVFENEPPGDSRITRYAEILITPHLAGSTRDAQLKVGLNIARQVAEYLTTGVIQNAVNTV